MMTKTQVNSIVIPGRYHVLCDDWAGDWGCMLRAISSAGNLTTGTDSPIRCDDCDGDPEKWYLAIWRRLSEDVGNAADSALKGWNDGEGDNADSDYPALVEFRAWVNATVRQLEQEYDLAGWAGVAGRTDVLFLRELDGDDIFAIFPAHAACVNRTDLMVCYAHVGQHGSASYDYCNECDEVIYNAEFADLFAELERAGYELYVIRKDCMNDSKYADSRRQEVGLC